jgi:hypothetical protein
MLKDGITAENISRSRDTMSCDQRALVARIGDSRAVELV